MEDIVIRECVTIDELDRCVHLQRDVFGLPDLEISPRRHLIVSRQAGGWTLGAFSEERLVGFVHHLAAVRGDDEVFGYSHMMAVAADFQNKGVGARLKWSQRERALQEGRTFIKWTWDPMQARNAHFNLNRLGVTVSDYAENFYGTDYATDPSLTDCEPAGIDSDRLFARWQLKSPRVLKLEKAAGEEVNHGIARAATIRIPPNWTQLCRENPRTARQEQLRVRGEFQQAFGRGLVAAGFQRSQTEPRYLLFTESEIALT
ncbi:MAG TPA: GNAT family N-acetyltransferase [Pyrinomonadaceae bacterium]|nr:GNAT family N-acetyltransferase [Pyrinomonadaceae bacterium]